MKPAGDAVAMASGDARTEIGEHSSLVGKVGEQNRTASNELTIQRCEDRHARWFGERASDAAGKAAKDFLVDVWGRVRKRCQQLREPRLPRQANRLLHPDRHRFL